MKNRFLRAASSSQLDCRKDFCAGSNRAIKHPFQPAAYKRGTGNYVRYPLWKSQKSQLERVEVKKVHSEHNPYALRSCPLRSQRDTSYDPPRTTSARHISTLIASSRARAWIYRSKAFCVAQKLKTNDVIDETEPEGFVAIRRGDERHSLANRNPYLASE